MPQDGLITMMVICIIIVFVGAFCFLAVRIDPLYALGIPGIFVVLATLCLVSILRE